MNIPSIQVNSSHGESLYYITDNENHRLFLGKGTSYLDYCQLNSNSPPGVASAINVYNRVKQTIAEEPTKILASKLSKNNCYDFGGHVIKFDFSYL